MKMKIRGKLSIEDLRNKVAEESIETVIGSLHRPLRSPGGQAL